MGASKYLQILNESFQECNKVFSSSDITRNSFLEEIIRKCYIAVNDLGPQGMGSSDLDLT